MKTNDSGDGFMETLESDLNVYRSLWNECFLVNSGGLETVGNIRDVSFTDPKSWGEVNLDCVRNGNVDEDGWCNWLDDDVEAAFTSCWGTVELKNVVWGGLFPPDGLWTRTKKS
jgi:hypothetical protein